MKTAWQTKKLNDVIDKVVYTKKIHRKRFLPSGRFPIVSQEQDFINGYWDNEKDLFRVKKPVAVFGDHTQVLKYIDFDFVLGADGVKILQSKPFVDSKFFYYSLQNINLKSLGYARHFRLLKEADIAFPESLAEQKRIVKKLNEVFEKVTKAKEAAEKNLLNAKELFESYLNNVFANPGKDWEGRTLGDICEIVNGTTPLRSNKSYWDNGDVRWFTVDDIREQGRVINETKQKITKKALEKIKSRMLPANTVLICCTASVGEYAIAKVPLITNQQFNGLVIKDRNLVDPEFLFYFAATLKHRLLILSGKATVDFISVSKLKGVQITFPSLAKQKSVVKKLNALSGETKKLEKIYEQKLADLEELKKSILSKAFHAEL